MNKKSLMSVVPTVVVLLVAARASDAREAMQHGQAQTASHTTAAPTFVRASAQCYEQGHTIEDPGDCIERIAIKECRTAKKKLYRTKIRHEYVAIPETRYKWKKKLVTKEIPVDYEKPICETKTVDHEYYVEKWDENDGVHCKTCETKTEKLPVKVCKSEPGKTTAKVCYWSCEKVPYTVYRQVKKEICVKQPCYVDVEVEITRYKCAKHEHCPTEPHCCTCEARLREVPGSAVVVGSPPDRLPTWH